MKKYIVISLLLVVIAVILASCHDTGGDKPVVSDTGQTTEAGTPSDVTTTAETETQENVELTSEVPTTYESGESGNETTEYVVNTEATANTTEGETEAPTEPKPTTPTPTEPKPTNPAPTEPKPTEPKPTAPKPTEAKPSPAQPKPTQPKPTEPKPTPTHPKPTTPTQPKHTHSFGAWKQSKAATCTGAGSEVRSCSCGATETRSVNATGHSWTAWKQSKAPTCSAAGAEARSCTRCGQKETRTVAATGNHTWTETAPTCTQAGAKVCKVCGTKSGGAAALGHAWVHHNEEGHWQPIITCYCGKVFYSVDDWSAHFDSFVDDEDELDNHAGYEVHDDWIIDRAAYDICSRCGIKKP